MSAGTESVVAAPRARVREREARAPAAVQARRIMWALLALAMFALPFLSLPGRYAFDTRDPLWLNPGAYLAKAFVLWHGSPYLGHEQHDAIAFPMGVVVWLIRTAGASPWVAERLWHGLLLFVGCAGTVLLVDRLIGRRTVAAPLTAGLVYMLSPYTFGYGLPFTGPFLPYVLLPTLLLVTLVGIGRKGLAWPALFGLVTLLMGGGNGAPQIDALIVAALLIAWVTFVQRGVHVWRGIRFAALALVFTVVLNAWWLVLLTSSEVSNALVYSEQPSIINASSSASETIRGLGFWMFYGGDQFGPWVPTVRAFATNWLLVITGFAVPIGALTAAWLTRWRHRLFFLFLMILGVFITAGVFPVHAPTPFGRLLLDAYRNVPGAAGLRTTYKFASGLNLSVAVLAGIGVGAALTRLRTVPNPGWAKAGAIAAVVLIVGANSSPLWTGHLYAKSRSTGPIPRYWQKALTALAGRDVRTRAFFAPATGSAIYRWGALKEGVAAAAPGDLAHVDPIRLPVGERFGSNLVAAAEQPYFEGLPAEGEAQLFRYLGVRDVVLQNDLDWKRSHTARPIAMQALKGDPDLTTYATFGVPGENVTGKTKDEDAQSVDEESLAPVEVLTVAHPVAFVRAETGDPVVVSGDGFGVAEAAREGLLDGGPPLLYSGSLGAGELAAVMTRSAPTFVVTDSNRRAVWSFTTPSGSHSATLPADRTLRGRKTGYDLFGGQSSTQSVAEYPGLQSITSSDDASSSASPEFRPANAFDGDHRTVWQTGEGSDPRGSWVKAEFGSPQTLSHVAVTLPPAGLGRQVRDVRLEFSNGSSVTASLEPGTTKRVSFSKRTASWIRLRILSVTKGLDTTNAVGIADIGIPGLDPAEIIRLPTDLFDAARSLPGGADALSSSPITYLFERQRTGTPDDVDQELTVRRRFEVPDTRSFAIAGTAALDQTAPDREIDRLLLGPSSVQVDSSSRLFGFPANRGSMAFDGNPKTEWVPSGNVGQSLTVSFHPRKIDKVVVSTDLSKGRSPITGVTATFSDGSSVSGTLPDLLHPDLTLSFPARTTSSVTITIDSIFRVNESKPRPIAITEVQIPGVQPLSFSGKQRLPCYDGAGFTIDGVQHGVRLDGTQKDLLSGEDLPLASCSHDVTVLPAGDHLLEAGSPLLVQSLALTTVGKGEPSTSDRPAPPKIATTVLPDGGLDIAVQHATAPYYLSVGQNIANGWHATIGGADLGAPILVDGYSAGWFVSRTGSYHVLVGYGPQTRYRAAIVLSAAAVVVSMALVVVEAVRRRRWRR
jgi:arabinofuranan 3-O-arabinosyltransferase